MNLYLEKAKEKFQASLKHLKDDIATLRTGRASAALVDNVLVEAYGNKMPINQLASISIPEPKMLIITPWDKAVIKEIEKGIIAAGIGINPVNEGASIRLVMPQMTEENRKELVKLLKQKSEKAKQTIRNVREEVRNEITEAEKNKELTQDDKFRYHKELDDHVQKVNDDV
ncbi:ribosome recycling factor [Candidatus Uhrbacteria bacterium]|nr:ribosome recycling factor [Candidatus Uhrbacteria bacterium]